MRGLERERERGMFQTSDARGTVAILLLIIPKNCKTKIDIVFMGFKCKYKNIC